jgi:predicted ATPase
MPRLHVTNYRALRDVTIDLTPVTALVGPNASGKSSVLRAVDPSTLVAPSDWWRGDTAPTVMRRIGLPAGDEYAVTSNLSGTSVTQGVVGGRAPFSFQSLRLELDALRNIPQVGRAESLSANGSNLVNVMGSLPLAAKLKVSEELARTIPVFSGVEVLPIEKREGFQQLVFHDRWHGLTYTAAEVSDGTLLTLAFLLLPHQVKRPLVLTIEEPERGLHPYLMGRVVQLLRDFAAPEGKLATQVILATQSADFVECLRPEEVRFLRRSPDDGRVIVESAPTGDPDWTSIFERYDESLGGMWLAGGLGGVPGNQ